MINPFSTEGVRRVVFGAGKAAECGEEVKLLGAGKALVVMDPVIAEMGVAQPVLDSLEAAGVSYVTFSDMTREPEPDEADAAAELGRKEKVEAVVGVGGGSALDLAKAAGVLITNEGPATDYVGLGKVKNPGKPIICLPTTAGTGSEVTWTAVFTRRADKFKGGINGRELYPTTAILDPELTRSCPPYVTAITGMDALTHAVESYISVRANPISEMNSLQAIALIGENLRQAVANGDNMEARANMLLGSYLAGLALAQAGVGAVHAMAYPLGSFYDIPHGEGNAVLLPFVMRHNLMACPDRFADMGHALCEVPDGATTREAAELFVEELFELSYEIGIPENLNKLGVPQAEVPAMAAKAMGVAVPIANNPRKVTQKDLEEIYHQAFK